MIASPEDKIISLISIFSENFEKNNISKFIVSKINNVNSENIEIFENFKYDGFKAMVIKGITLKAERKINITYRYPSKDIAKNYDLETFKAILLKTLGPLFLQADLYLTEKSVHVLISKKTVSMFEKAFTIAKPISSEHNRQKNYILGTEAHPFLKELGVYTQNNQLIDNKRDKFKQINKFLEFFDQTIQGLKQEKKISVVDMGSGKGYLTFAMYHHLTNTLGLKAEVFGIEMRPEMISLCNKIAANIGFEHLKFIEGTIDSYALNPNINVLIALHACDTATDDAIIKGIKNKIPVLMLAPCCHKQVRKSLSAKTELAVFEKHGIIKERFAETITDLIRSLILEAHGYETKIFEFIGAENTPKNVMITAVMTKFTQKTYLSKIAEINALKAVVGLKHHYLEQVFNQ
jgi:SAM-dependent methyltransferase